jgi:hypothetical protein
MALQTSIEHVEKGTRGDARITGRIDRPSGSERRTGHPRQDTLVFWTDSPPHRRFSAPGYTVLALHRSVALRGDRMTEGHQSVAPQYVMSWTPRGTPRQRS